MSKTQKSGWYFAGWISFWVIIVVVMTICIIWGENNKATNTFNYGYCYAMKGELIASDICARDNVIIPIPPRP